ncbi:MAG: hypothetical protein V3U78_04600 [Thiotrichaceae bacterium]
MTVSSEIARKDYAGDDVTTVFPTTFKFLEKDHVKVILTLDGFETILERITNYEIIGENLPSGDVIMNVPPAIGETLTIKRGIPLLQGTDYIENDPFPANAHERALDLLTMIAQVLQEELDRTVKFAESETSTGLTLPPPEEGLFLVWDANGDLENVQIKDAGTLLVSSFAETYLDDTTATTTRNTLVAMGKIVSAPEDNIVTFSSLGDSKNSTISRNQITLSANAAGTANVIIGIFSPAITSFNDGQMVRVRASAANTSTTPTFEANLVAARTIVKNGNQPLNNGDISGPDHELLLVSNTSNNVWELLNPATKHHAELNWDGTGVISITKSYGIAMISDLGIGLTRVTVINQFPDINFAAAGIAERVGSASASQQINTSPDEAVTTTTILLENHNQQGTLNDGPRNTVIFDTI